MATVTIELKHDTVDSIVRQELTEHLRGCEADVRRLEQIAVQNGGLRDYEREDLANYADSIIALKKVIRLYQCPSDWED